MIHTYEDVENFFENRAQFGIQPGLERMHLLLESLGNPQNDIKGIHIAGTNGKGSTAAYIKQSLMALGYEVGMFTSPSFQGLTGHMFKNNKPIPTDEFIHLVQKVRPVVAKLDTMKKHPTEFEIITAIAFLYFKENTDFVIVEAGMGGKEDTTNCFTPLVSVITNVALDHTAFLGNTIKDITHHKAGIIKQNRPIILGKTVPEVEVLVKKKAQDLDAPVFIYGKDYTTRNKLFLNNTFTYHSKRQTLEITLSMSGEHQMINAATALCTLEQLDETIPLDWEKIRMAFLEVTLPGRFEKVLENQSLYLDGAHNEAGMHALIKTLQPHQLDKDIEILFSGFKDKDLESIVKQLQANFESVTFTTFSHPRALAKKAASTFASEHNMPFEESWKTWINERLCHTNEANKMYIVTGSLHFMMQVRAFLLAK